jgi:hypothetical protein
VVLCFQSAIFTDLLVRATSRIFTDISSDIQVANPVFEDLQMDIVMKQPTYFLAGSEAVN